MPDQASSPLTVRVTPDPTRVAAALGRAGNAREFRKIVTKNMEGVSKLAATALRNAIRSIPATSGESTGLRSRMVGAVRTETKIAGGILADSRSQVSVMVDSTKMGTQRTLPRHLERAKGWRHPVYGNREVWVTQPGHPFFYSTLDYFMPEWSAAVRAAMEETVRKASST